MTLSHQLRAAPENRAAECDPGVEYPSSWDALCFPHAVLGRVMLHLSCWVGSPFSKYFLGFSGIFLWLPQLLAGTSPHPSHFSLALRWCQCSTKKGTLTPSLLALVFSRFQCLFSVSEVSSAFFPGQKQDVGCARRHLWVSCIPFFFSAV